MCATSRPIFRHRSSNGERQDGICADLLIEDGQQIHAGNPLFHHGMASNHSVTPTPLSIQGLRDRHWPRCVPQGWAMSVVLVT
jgi:hypothetical protein